MIDNAWTYNTTTGTLLIIEVGSLPSDFGFYFPLNVVSIRCNPSIFRRGYQLQGSINRMPDLRKTILHWSKIGQKGNWCCDYGSISFRSFPPVYPQYTDDDYYNYFDDDYYYRRGKGALIPTTEPTITNDDDYTTDDRSFVQAPITTTGDSTDDDYTTDDRQIVQAPITSIDDDYADTTDDDDGKYSFHNKLNE